MENDKLQKQPLSRITWMNREELKPNNYNPNKVAPPELKLLKISILEDGWTQPIVANADGTIRRWLPQMDSFWT